jgi:tetratricopeptide (TPR) repeat protein
MPLAGEPDEDEVPDEDVRKTEAWQMIHQPWVLPTKEKKLEAYKALLNCDFVTLLLNAKGTRDLMAQGDTYGKMIAECKTDPMALEKFVLSGQACGMQAMAVLSKDLVRRNKLPKNKPETPPKSAAEAKDYAGKLFKAQKFSHAADMYNMAISLCQVSRGLTTVSKCAPSGDSERPVAFAVAATPRTEQNVEDESLIHTLYANLAFCRVKQHRWGEAIGACDEAIKLEPFYCKAILRRGYSKRMLKLWKEAQADARKAIRISTEQLELGVGDAKLHRDMIKEGNGLIDDVQKQVDKLAKDKARQEREEKGIELADGDPIFGTDFDHVLRRELKR